MYWIVFYILISISLCPVFAKAYIPQYYAFVPIIQQFFLLKMVEKKWWYILLLLIPLIGIFVWLYLSVLISRAFDKNILFSIGLFIFPPLFLAILGFGNSVYCGGYRYIN